MDENSKIVIFGGLGFLGRYVVNRLAKSNARIVVVGRSAVFRSDFTTMCAVGQVSFQKLPSTKADWNTLLSNATHVVSLINILFETQNETFQIDYVELTEKIAHFAKLNGVSRFVHVSALACKTNKSNYVITKVAGERAVLKEFPEAVILRPSVMFGVEDNFFNLFAKIIKYSFFVPMIVLGRTKLQPVYVDDVAAALEKCCDSTALDVEGKIFEVAGNRQYSMKQLMKMLAELMHRKRIFIPIPFFLSLIIAYFLQMLPFHLLTVDQVRSLQKNSVVVSENALEIFGIKPKSLHFFLKKYIR